MRSDLGTVKGLKDRCQRFRAHLAEHGRIPDAELKAHWPGGAANRDTGLAGWIYCYGTYRAFLDRADRLDGAAAADGQAAVRRQARLDATRAHAQTVELTDREPDGGPRFAHVHPKSLDALIQIEDADRYLADLTVALRQLMPRRADPACGDALSKVLAEISYQHRLITSIACHPGPTSPYSDVVARVEPHAWTAALTPADVTAILLAFREVNGRRVLEARELFLDGRDEPARAVSWETLVAVVAKRRGVPSPHLMRHQDLPSLLVELDIARAAEAEATAAEAD